MRFALCLLFAAFCASAHAQPRNVKNPCTCAPAQVPDTHVSGGQTYYRDWDGVYRLERNLGRTRGVGGSTGDLGDRITTTDGLSYVRAADGFYPAVAVGTYQIHWAAPSGYRGQRNGMYTAPTCPNGRCPR